MANPRATSPAEGAPGWLATLALRPKPALMRADHSAAADAPGEVVGRLAGVGSYPRHDHFTIPSARRALHLMNLMDAFAWPLAATVIVIAALLVFRAPIAGLIGRVQKVKLPGGFHADASVPAQIAEQTAENASQLALSPPPQLGSPPPNAVSEQFETETRKLLEENFKDKDLQLAWAIRAFAVADLERAHEANYRLMFGSQIAALKNVNQSGRRQPLEALRQFYNQAAAQWPAAYAAFSFDAWGNFLTRCRYVDVRDDTVEVTLFGRDFLMWMTGRGVFEGKVL